MRPGWSSAFVPFVAFVALASPLGAQQKDAMAELEAARRPPATEPKYMGIPRYLLLAFGRPIHRTAWCVLDGETLYVDRDGDGALDAAKEKLAPRREKLEKHFVAEQLTYAVGALPATKDSPAYPKLEIVAHTWNLAYEPSEELREVMETLRANPSLRNPTVKLERARGPQQFAMTEFAATIAEATVLHFDAPLTWGVVENLVPDRLTAGEEYDFEVSLGTPGLGPWSFVYTHSTDRKELRPELEVTFAAGEGKKPIPARWTLPEWC